MTEAKFVRGVAWICWRLGLFTAKFPKTIIFLSFVFTILMAVKMVITPQVSALDGYAADNARSRYEYKAFQDFLDSGGRGILLMILVMAKDRGNMLRLPYLKATVNNGLRVSEDSDNDTDFKSRVNLSYPFSSIFGRKFSLLPNFYGVELSKDNHTLQSSSMIGMIFRAEKHASWTTNGVKEWEKRVGNFFRYKYNQSRIKVRVASPAIVEAEVVRAGMSVYGFLGFGYVSMIIFVASTTIFSAVAVYSQTITVNKIVLSVCACVNPLLAVGSAMGVIFVVGVQHSPILSITLFLVLAISVDDSFLMLHAWNRIEKRQLERTRKWERNEKIAQVLVETGSAITISAMTHILAFAIGALTSPQEMRIFCIGNAVAIPFDMFYQATFYTACMMLFADGPEQNTSDDPKWVISLKKNVVTFLHSYVEAISSIPVSAAILFAWFAYLTGIIVMRVDLSSQNLFLPDSPILEMDLLRVKEVIPYCTPCAVVVHSPGDIDDPIDVQKLQLLKRDLEKLPFAIGPTSAKFFLDDYAVFKESMNEEPPEGDVEEDDDGVERLTPSIETFLSWPEFSFWRGFLNLQNSTKSGKQLETWAARGRLLKSWRETVDRHSENTPTYAIPTITWQSALGTFLCMIVVCGFFYGDVSTVVIVSITILSNVIGVFGILSLCGIPLDPMLMAVSIMSIGFSVDIPAHVTFHYFTSGKEKMLKMKASVASASSGGKPWSNVVLPPEQLTPDEESHRDFVQRMRHTLSSVSYPVIQAALSTDVCVLPLGFVALYMARVFAWAIIMGVTLSLVHGLVVLPAILTMRQHAKLWFFKRIHPEPTPVIKMSQRVL